MANEFKAKNGLIAPTLQSTVATGTAPLTVTSTTLVTNLNSDYLEGQHGSYYLDRTNATNKPDPVITVTLTGDVTGTANTTLTDLASGTISVVTTIAADSVALGTDTTGNYVASITNGSYITGGNGGSEGAAITLAVDATSANTASKVVARDASGNFSAGTITAALSGNASTATNISGGSANVIAYQTAANTTSFIAAPTVASTTLTWNGSAFTWATGGGATITDDTTTDATRYLVWEEHTSGTSTSVGVSTTKLYFNPSTGTLNSTNFNSLSDITLKKDVSQISNALTTLNAINGVQFTWKDNNKKSYGVIAQELEKILPDIVETSETNIKTVNYAALTGFLIEAIKELNEEINILKSRK